MPNISPAASHSPDRTPNQNATDEAISPGSGFPSRELTAGKVGEGSIWPRLLIALALIALPLVYFYPAAIGKITLLPGDGLTQNLGVRVLIGQMISSGQLPLWNPYIFAGTPLLASIYPGALYPPNWLFALFSPAMAMNIVVITTYHLTIIGTYLYSRRIGMTPVGALIAGTTFTFGGYMIAHMGHTSRIAAAAWLPWILLAIEELYHCIRWRWVALGSLFIALQLFAGEPQMSFYTVLVCAAYLLYGLILRDASETRGRFLFGTAAMAVCGLLVSMIQLLPERELLKLGERAKISYEYFSGYSFPPANIFSFIFPFFFGGGMIWPYKVEYWGQSTIDEACGYFGLLPLLLGLIALFGSKRWSLAQFWSAIALVSLLLAFGWYLPTKLNRALYHLPIYNLFRASGRHMFEFTFSAGILAGLGASYIARAEWRQLKRVLERGLVVFIALVACTAITYRFFGDYLVTGQQRSASAASLTTPESLVPLVFAALSLITLWICSRWRGAASSILLIVMIFADLATFSLAFNYGWRDFVSNVTSRLQDPPAVQFIKSREHDLNSFRIVSYSLKPYGAFYRELNFPNVSIVRGLQSINGYDALRLPRPAAVAGEMGIDGLIMDLGLFDSEHQGLNLLNVKYLLRERHREEKRENGPVIEGIRFGQEAISLNLVPGRHVQIAVNQVLASELAIVSIMANSVHVPDETPAARIKLHTREGRVIEREIRAGRDSAEWAYDREDVRAKIKHRKPLIAESWPADGFKAYRYLARIPFDRARIERIEFNYLLQDALILIQRASLFDPATGESTPLDLMNLPAERWRNVAIFDDVEIHENLRVQPRAWFVDRAAVESSADVIRTIKSGKMKDGSRFDPARMVLFEKEDFGNREIVLPQIGEPTNAEVKVMHYDPNRIVLETRNGQPGFLVVSEIYYRGWEASIDGVRTPLERVNFALRGLAVPAGNHRIEIVFRAPSLRNGAFFSALGVILLAVGGIVALRRRSGHYGDALKQ